MEPKFKVGQKVKLNKDSEHTILAWVYKARNMYYTISSVDSLVNEIYLSAIEEPKMSKKEEVTFKDFYGCEFKLGDVVTTLEDNNHISYEEDVTVIAVSLNGKLIVENDNGNIGKFDPKDLDAGKVEHVYLFVRDNKSDFGGYIDIDELDMSGQCVCKVIVHSDSTNVRCPKCGEPIKLDYN